MKCVHSLGFILSQFIASHVAVANLAAGAAVAFAGSGGGGGIVDGVGGSDVY